MKIDGMTVLHHKHGTDTVHERVLCSDENLQYFLSLGYESTETPIKTVAPPATIVVPPKVDSTPNPIVPPQVIEKTSEVLVVPTKLEKIPWWKWLFFKIFKRKQGV